MSRRGSGHPVRLHPRCACAGAPELKIVASSPRNLPAFATCPACGSKRRLHLEHLSGNGGLLGCLMCGHAELFTRKLFPTALGLVIVAAAAILAPFTGYLSLAVAALIDFVLFLWLQDEVVCYVCLTRHCGFASDPRHPRFDRQIDERLRYGERAVMGKPMRESGSANAPEPEH